MVRKLALHKMIGSIPNTGDSVKEIRKIRRKLSKDIKSFKDLEKINIISGIRDVISGKVKEVYSFSKISSTSSTNL